jgi:hypothetical protein
MPAVGTDAEWVDYVGLRLIKDVEIEIGGQRIKFVGAQKHQAAASLCKAAENSFGGAHYPFHGHGINMGMPQMLVAC